MAKGSDIYGDFGSVPTVMPDTETRPEPRLTVSASPQDMGAQIGAATEKAGQQSLDAAQKWQGMVNETLMTNADAALAMKVGQIKGQYLQNTGLAAAAAFPKYQTELEAARQEARASLPGGAARGFDMLSMRTIANHIADGSTYAASQTRQALIDSGTNLKNANVQAVLDPSIATDPERVKYHQDSAIHGLQMTLDENHPGMKTDPETGAVSFDESNPAGQALKANYEADKDNIITQVQANRFDTLAKGDVLSAHDLYLQERDTFPRSTQVHLDSTFAPKVFNAHVENGTNQVLASAEQEHAKLLYYPQADSAIAWTMQHEGGFVPNDSGKGPTKFGINQESNPGVDVANLTQQEAAKIMHDKYYLGVGADKMSPQMSAVALDTAVNMGVGKAKALIAQAGDDPQKLIDLRRTEYQRLATENPEKYGQYLDGWNQRLDDLQKTVGESPKKSYGTNPDGSPLSLADYYRTHSEDVLERADALAESQMPGDLSYRKAMRETVTNYMNKTISNQSAQYVMDNRSVMRAINGEMTKGHPPETEEELRAVPGMGELLDRVAVQDPKFAESVPTLISKVARRDDKTNSANGYETIMRTLEPNDNINNPNRIASVDHLAHLLGRSDGTGINMKDYNDAKQVVEADQVWKDFLSKNMKQITSANGNLDGKGQDRALEWYHQVADAKKQNDAKGDKALPTSAFIASVGQKDGPPIPTPPSRMQQIENWAKGLFKSKESEIPVLTAKSQFDALPSGSVYIRDGQKYRKP